MSYSGETVSIEEAHTNGWVQKYLYWYDPDIANYCYAEAPDGQLDPWVGYWVKATVECDLVIPATPLTT